MRQSAFINLKFPRSWGFFLFGGRGGVVKTSILTIFGLQMKTYTRKKYFWKWKSWENWLVSIIRALHISIPGFFFYLKVVHQQNHELHGPCCKISDKGRSLQYTIFFLLQSESYSIYEIPRQVCVWAMYSNYRVSMYASCFVLGLKYKFNESG